MNTKILDLILCSEDLDKFKALSKFFKNYSIIGQEVKIKSLSTDSGVSRLPFSDEEMILGARNRIKYAKNTLNADLYIAIEGGIKKINHRLFIGNWTIISDHTNLECIGSSSFLEVPKPMHQYLSPDDGVGQLKTHLGIKSGGINTVLTKKMSSRMDELYEGIRNAFFATKYQIERTINLDNQA